jgi:hypothetical protein
VIFLRGAAPKHRLDLGGDRHIYLSFQYLACELASIPYEHHRESENIVARLNLPSMRYAPEHKVDAYALAVRGLVQLERDPEKQLRYLDLIDTYADLEDNERARYQREYPDEAAIMGTFSERIIQQGMEQGEHLGVRKGETKVLLTQLQLKFGPVSEAVRAKIERADADTLLRWSERILSATSIEQVLGADG